ncbi:MAG TPA: hypothetical protein VHQ39_12900 [Dongiaceae bacterium]|nr:hypothetical protein [Dongiaceae bacterium]
MNDISRPPVQDAATIVAAMFSRALGQFEDPARGISLRRHAWRVGPWRIEQRHLGPSLEDLFYPAWAHLPDPGAGQRPESIEGRGLIVYCADVQASGLDLGPLPWRAGETASQGFVAGLDGSDYRALWDQQGCAVHLFDRRRGIAIYAVRSRNDFRSWERSLPLRSILHWWTAAEGGQLLHAGAVGTAEGGALLLGASGAGKSTTTLACLASGLAIAGDDFVLVEPAGSNAVIHSVSTTAKLSRAALLRFPHLASAVANPLEAEPEKALFFLDRFTPSPLIAAMPLKALLMLNRVPRRDTAIEPVNPAAALAASAPNTLFMLPGDRAGAFAKIARIFRSQPCFRIELGDDLPQIPQRIGELLARL